MGDLIEGGTHSESPTRNVQAAEFAFLNQFGWRTGDGDGVEYEEWVGKSRGVCADIPQLQRERVQLVGVKVCPIQAELRAYRGAADRFAIVMDFAVVANDAANGDRIAALRINGDLRENPRPTWGDHKLGILKPDLTELAFRKVVE